MRVIVNGQEHEARAATLEELLCEMNLAKKWCATAVNSRMVPRSARQETRLEEGDRIEILSPMQGG